MSPSHNHWPVLQATIINTFSPHSHKESPVYITLSKQKKPVSGIRFPHKATPLSPKQQLPLDQIQWTQSQTEPRCQNCFFFPFLPPRTNLAMENLNPAKRSEHWEHQKEHNFIGEKKKKEKPKFKAEAVRSLRSVNGGFGGFYEVWTAPTNNSMWVCRCFFPVMALLPLSSLLCSCRT